MGKLSKLNIWMILVKIIFSFIYLTNIAIIFLNIHKAVALQSVIEGSVGDLKFWLVIQRRVKRGSGLVWIIIDMSLQQFKFRKDASPIAQTIQSKINHSF